MSFSVSREQVIRCIRERGWFFDEQGKKAQLYRQTGNTRRLALPTRAFYPEAMLRIILAQAGFSAVEIERFFADALKEPPDKKQ